MRTLTLTFAGALLLGTSAFAGGAAADPAWMQRADIDGDGTITQAEMQRFQTLTLAHLDTNRDNLITASEWAKRPDFTFEYADLNSDGVLMPEELHNAYLSGWRYNYAGVKTVPTYGTTYTTTYPAGTVYSYSYYPYSYQGALTPPVAAVPTTTVIPAPVPVYVVPRTTYVPPAEGYILQGRVQQPIYAPQPNYATQPAYGYTVTGNSELAYGDLSPGNPFALDVNRDGVLTISEVLRYNDGKFQTVDRDGSGWIDVYEWDLKAQEHFGHRVNPAALGTLSHDTFGRHDRDGDGRVSKLEWDRQIEAEFTVLDTDRDGVLRQGDFQLANR